MTQKNGHGKNFWFFSQFKQVLLPASAPTCATPELPMAPCAHAFKQTRRFISSGISERGGFPALPLKAGKLFRDPSSFAHSWRADLSLIRRTLPAFSHRAFEASQSLITELGSLGRRIFSRQVNFEKNAPISGQAVKNRTQSVGNLPENCRKPQLARELLTSKENTLWSIGSCEVSEEM